MSTPALGLVVGFVLSALAAMGQPDHYLEIVLPGMLLGLIVGFVTQRRRPEAVTQTIPHRVSVFTSPEDWLN